LEDSATLWSVKDVLKLRPAFGHMGGSHIQSGDPCGFISGENDENHVFSWQEIHVVKRFSMEKSQHVFFIPDIWGVQGIFLKVLTTIEIPST
jgi:hypothetical protein